MGNWRNLPPLRKGHWFSPSEFMAECEDAACGEIHSGIDRVAIYTAGVQHIEETGHYVSVGHRRWTLGIGPEDLR